jgi:hypothetical protein
MLFDNYGTKKEGFGGGAGDPSRVLNQAKEERVIARLLNNIYIPLHNILPYDR